MQKWIFLFILLFTAGCSSVQYEPVDEQQSFVATVNILQPSLQFFDEQGQLIAQWQLEHAFSGATLVAEDYVLLYGHQLTEAYLYELSTGQLIREIETPKGSTNGYYDTQSEQFFITNSVKNELYAYTKQGEIVGTVALRNYPMSMLTHDNYLYVVNYKDTLLSVVDTKTLEVIDEWPIPSSSQGLWYDISKDHLWLGGHGSGTKANEIVRILDAKSGEQISTLELPLMPIAIASNGEEQAIVSHGNSTLYTVQNETITYEKKISANPFAVAYFNEQIVVAGYDDATLYFIDEQQIQREVETQKGPFQILTKERQR